MDEKTQLLKLADFADNPELATANALIAIEAMLEESAQSNESQELIEMISGLIAAIPSDRPLLEEIREKLDEEHEVEVTLNING